MAENLLFACMYVVDYGLILIVPEIINILVLKSD